MKLRAGLQTKEVDIFVDREMIEEYIKALGKTSLGETIFEAPITFVIMFWKLIDIPWLCSYDGLIHGEQSFELNEPIRCNQCYTVSITLTEIKPKRNFELLIHTLSITKQGQSIGQATSTMIRQVEVGTKKSENN